MVTPVPFDKATFSFYRGIVHYCMLANYHLHQYSLPSGQMIEGNSTVPGHTNEVNAFSGVFERYMTPNRFFEAEPRHTIAAPYFGYCQRARRGGCF
jgi:hypothetical protein